MQAYDRYAYVNNNPLRYTDPSGHCPTCLGGFVVGAIAGAAIYVVTTSASGRTFNPVDFGIAAATGAIGGTLIGTGLGAAAGVATFAAIGAGGGLLTAQAGYSMASGEEYQSDEMLVAAGVGAGTGAISGALGAPASVNPLSGTITSAAIRAGTNFVAGSAQYIGTQLVNGEPIDPANAAIAGGVSYVTGGITDGIFLIGSYTGKMVDLFGLPFIRENMRVPFAKLVLLDGISEGVTSWSVNSVSNNYPKLKEIIRSAPSYIAQ